MSEAKKRLYERMKETAKGIWERIAEKKIVTSDVTFDYNAILEREEEFIWIVTKTGTYLAFRDTPNIVGSTAYWLSPEEKSVPFHGSTINGAIEPISVKQAQEMVQKWSTEYRAEKKGKII
ncbi:MAG: hypothetical protein HQK59_05915 [Deltaproteobacteria bacterium]|nr:hypothetical protein [Deltaproteobacteria bacterium]